MDCFITFDELVNLESKYDELINDEPKNKINYKKCIKCNIEMNLTIYNKLICPECGISKEVITENYEYNTMESYSTSENKTQIINFSGKESNVFQRIARNNNENRYFIIQENITKKRLQNLNYDNTSSDLNIPKFILMNVLEQYKQIKSIKKIYRGEVLKGILAALVYHECLKNGMIRSPKEIIDWANIDVNKFSKGKKIVEELYGANVIEIDNECDITDKYIKSYLIRLNIDEVYFNYIHDMIEEMDTIPKSIFISRIKTKVATLIYMIIKLHDLDIEDDTLLNEFKVSITTIKTLYKNILKNQNCFESIFVKHNLVSRVEYIKNLTSKRRTKKN